jgi:hypothetical protein
MNKKLFLVSVVTLLLGTTSVMADNHKHHDGPQKPKKEVVQKQNKKDDKKDKHSKNDRHFDTKVNIKLLNINPLCTRHLKKNL